MTSGDLEAGGEEGREKGKERRREAVGSGFGSCLANTGLCCDVRQNLAFLRLTLPCEQDEALTQAVRTGGGGFARRICKHTL